MLCCAMHSAAAMGKDIYSAVFYTLHARYALFAAIILRASQKYDDELVGRVTRFFPQSNIFLITESKNGNKKGS